jgi:hypothetical protein
MNKERFAELSEAIQQTKAVRRGECAGNNLRYAGASGLMNSIARICRPPRAIRPSAGPANISTRRERAAGSVSH